MTPSSAASTMRRRRAAPARAEPGPRDEADDGSDALASFALDPLLGLVVAYRAPPADDA